MRKTTARRSSKAGLPPGTPVHIGQKKIERSRIKILDYSETEVREREVETLDQCFALTGAPGVTWVSVTGVHDVEILQRLGDCFELHPLVLEDITNTEQRPKLEDYEGYSFMVLKTFGTTTPDLDTYVDQVSLILGSNFVISFEERESDLFDSIRERISNGRGHIRKAGPDYLAYSLIDAVVDRYFVVLEALGEKVEDLEEKLVTDPTSATLQVVHQLKSEMIVLRKAMWPLREVIAALGRGESPLIQETTAVYLRDVHDHIIEVIDTMETYREMVSGMLDIYLSSISLRMNEIMKVLTIIATIFIPLTFVAGVYGMNFRNMPEISSPWGYPAVLMVMALGAGGMLMYFRKRKWV